MIRLYYVPQAPISRLKYCFSTYTKALSLSSDITAADDEGEYEIQLHFLDDNIRIIWLNAKVNCYSLAWLFQLSIV